MAKEYKPDYLKVAGKDGKPISEIDCVLRRHSSLIATIALIRHEENKINPDYFGFFTEKLRTTEYSVLEFNPFSIETGFTEKTTLYKTREEALKKAIVYLDEKGYSAKPFDLEGMIEKV